MKKIITLIFLLISLLGQTLVSPQAVNAASEAATTDIVYVVKRGDSLSAIAFRYGVSLNALVQANRLTRWVIQPGQRLVIPSRTVTGSVKPSTPAKNKSIYVSIGQQRMYVYENGVQIRSYVVSTGQRGHETVPGNYRVKTRLAQAWGSAWQFWMPSWLGIYDVGRYENGIHALPVNTSGQVLWEGSLGAPASYGCVVLRGSDAAQLYQWADLGTPVIIRY